MAEYEGETNEALVSAFIVGTCQLLPKQSPYQSDHMHNLVASADSKPDYYVIVCGSHVEFYIDPLNTCIDDIDILMARNDHLAISGCDLRLPSDVSGLSDTIKCYKIESYKMYPGFVQLRVWEEMKYNWKFNKFEFDHTSFAGDYAVLDMVRVANKYFQSGLLHGRCLSKSPSGPAIKHRRDMGYGGLSTVDYVECMTCPQWPREAKGWIKRPRNNGWPTIDTIDDVVRNGCHVVYVQHRSCRDDRFQWRLSFSLAEVILIQSWTQIQQIVYHLLRFFAKRVLIRKDCKKEDEVLCTYHIKTLMLWTCEEMSPKWWNSSSVITICSELLKKLADWLKKRHCPNYFVPDANLFHESSSSTMQAKIECRITKFCISGNISDWFKEHYILPIIWRHLKSPRTINVTPCRPIMDFMLRLIDHWKVNEIKSLDSNLFYTFGRCYGFSRSLIQRGISSLLYRSMSPGYYDRCKAQKVEQQLKDTTAIQNVFCFTYFEKLLYSLHTAYGLDCEEISWDCSLFLEFVTAVTSQPKMIRSLYHNYPKAYSATSNQFQFQRTQNLMQNLTDSNNRAEFQLLTFVSKEFLRKALENYVSKSDEIASAALVYLAALHFATSEYQQAIRLCHEILVDQTSLKDKETLNAGCLFFIDDIARIIGFCVLHKKMTKRFLYYDSRRFYLDLRLSPEVFAHYLVVLFSEKIPKHFDFNCNFPNAEFPMDDYLNALANSKCVASTKSDVHVNPVRQIVYRRPGSLKATEATAVNPLNIKEAIIPVLMEYALENMTSFYDVFRKDFGIKCHTVDCYRALYLYKCHQYIQVMQLCEQILEEPDLQSNLKIFAFANVLLMPPLDSYFDRDVQSLLGFHTLFYYLSPFNYDMETDAPGKELGFEHRFAQIINYNKGALALLLQCRYTVKRHYFIGRHFLARYLKLRCCIDCNLPYSESLAEFVVHKINLPFEHLIRRFLLQTCRLIGKNSRI